VVVVVAPVPERDTMILLPLERLKVKVAAESLCHSGTERHRHRQTLYVPAR